MRVGTTLGHDALRGARKGKCCYRQGMDRGQPPPSSPHSPDYPIIVKQVAVHVRALGHPVQPKATVRMIDVVVADLDVNCSMELDPRHLSTGEQTPNVNVMDRIASNYGVYILTFSRTAPPSSS
jgi:hypothetical protein